MKSRQRKQLAVLISTALILGVISPAVSAEELVFCEPVSVEAPDANSEAALETPVTSPETIGEILVTDPETAEEALATDSKSAGENLVTDPGSMEGTSAMNPETTVEAPAMDSEATEVTPATTPETAEETPATNSEAAEEAPTIDSETTVEAPATTPETEAVVANPGEMEPPAAYPEEDELVIDNCGDIEPETFAPLPEETEPDGLLAGPLAVSFDTPNLIGASSVSDNRDAQSYYTWAFPVNSYLIAEGNGYLRVENCSDQILIERYDSSFVLQNQSTLARELPIFGGFFAGSNAYYIASGQNNVEENDQKEVIRITKYDKNWKRLGAASLCGANTIHPFEAGSLRMTEYGGYLYIRTCHEMYTSSDGRNHQANLMLQVRTSDMAVTDSYYKVMNIGSGYVSHSFNQFILADDAGNLVALDHGDAGPRSFALGKYNKKAGESTFTGYYSAIGFLPFPGDIGNNYTGASIGALEYSGSCYLTAGNSVRQDANWQNNRVRNIFVTVTPRSTFSASGSTIVWITNYGEDSGLTISTPHLTKLSSDCFLLLWTESSSEQHSLRYLFLDGSGNVISDIKSADGCLSDCKPIATAQGALWYVTDGKKLTFCRIDNDGTFHAEPGHIHTYEPEMTFQHSKLECGLIEGTVSNPLKTNSDGEITYTSSNPGIARVNQDGTVVLNSLGSCTITASASAGVDYRAKSASYTLTVLDLKKQVITVSKSLTKTYGDADFSLQASCLGKAALTYSVSNQKVAAVSANGTVSIKNAGKTTITVRAEQNGSYAGAQATVTLTVKPMNVSRLKPVFTRIGDILLNQVNNSILVWDGKKLLKPDTDYELWVYYYTYNPFSGAILSVDAELSGCGNYTGTVTCRMYPINKRPSLLSAASGKNGVSLKWEKESNAIGYKIYRKQGSGNYQKVKTISSSDTVTWTDSEIKQPSVTVSYYIKAYTNNGSKAVHSSASAVKTIQPVKVTPRSLSSCKVTLSKRKYTYNGKARKPSVTVTDGTKKLTKNTDYTVSYTGNKQPGTATVTITGKGNYTGSIKQTFQIVKKAQSWKVTLSSRTLKAGKTALIKVEGAVGKVTYKSGNKKIATVNAKGKIKAIAPGEVTITVTAAGDKTCKSASKSFKITVSSAAPASTRTPAAASLSQETPYSD